MDYIQEHDLFELTYNPDKITIEEVFEAVERLGQQRGVPYRCKPFPCSDGGSAVGSS
jgi:hypothetical protein